jgi:hypothetical protein
MARPSCGRMIGVCESGYRKREPLSRSGEADKGCAVRSILFYALAPGHKLG